MNPLIGACGAFCLGIYVGVESIAFHLPWLIFVAVSVCLVIFAYRLSGTLRLSLTVVFLCFSLGAYTGDRAWRWPSTHLHHYVGSTLVVEGTMVPGSLTQNASGVYLLLESDSVVVQGARRPAQGRVRVSLTSLPKKAKIPACARVGVTGVLKPVTYYLTPGCIDSRVQAKINDIAGRMSVKGAQVHFIPQTPTLLHRIAILNFSLKELLTRYMSTVASSVLAGMALGGYEGIETQTVRDFAQTGMVHILSVSGSHIALLISFVLGVGRYLQIRKKHMLVPAGLLLIFYGLLCGFSPPVLRSVLMGLVVLWGYLLPHKADRGAVLALAAILCLIYRPLWLYDIGFQLSFASTAGLIYLVPVLTQRVPSALPHYLTEPLTVCLSVQLAVLPLQIHYFHYLSLTAFCANLVVMPLLEFALLSCLCGFALYLISAELAAVCLMVAAQVVSPALYLLEIMGAWEMGGVTIASVPSIYAFPYYGALACMSGLVPRTLPGNYRKLIATCCVLLLVVQQLYAHYLPQPFTVYFLDVGQGDCALIKTPERHSILIDTGGIMGDYDIGGRVIVPALRALGVSHLDALILSHGHHDHAGGAESIAALMRIDYLLLPEEKLTGDVTQFLHTLRARQRTQLAILHTGESFTLGSCVIKIIAAEKNTMGSSNESSAVVLVACAGGKVLFTGDLPEEGESALKGDIRADLLKVAHHGSATSSSSAFLKAVSPKEAVISVGRGNRFGHPTAQVLERLAEAGINVHRTDLDGTVRAVYEDGKFWVRGTRDDEG